MPKYLTREQARNFLLDQGIPVKGEGMKDLAKRGVGPSYCILNGRALYTREDLLKWIDERSKEPLRVRRANERVPIAQAVQS